MAERPKAPTKQALPDDRPAALQEKIDRLLQSMEALRREVASIKSEADAVGRDIQDMKRQVRNRWR